MSHSSLATNDNQDLIEHLARQTSLPAAKLNNLVAEILAYYNETPETFICRRHLELRQQGHSNSAIYAAIQQEVTVRLFATEPHSERQIRRIIYG